MTPHTLLRKAAPFMRQPSSKQKGFALVATITIMAILALVALAMLSLGTVETRAAKHNNARLEAQANARLALAIALGELQKSAGADQRVTAEADITGAAGHGKHHWVGVWSSQDNDNDGLADGDFLGWLASSATVSKNLLYSEISTPAPEESDPAWASMVGAGSADTTSEPKNAVLAEKVPLYDKSDEFSTNEASGHYAWWVGDEGVKARVNLENTQENLALAGQQTERAAIEVMAGFEEVAKDEENLDTAITTNSLRLIPGVAKDAFKKNFHSVTSHSYALATDTKNGGLKTDLSLLFEMNDAEFEAIAPADYAAYVNLDTPVSTEATEPKGLLFHQDNIHGPTIDVLRNHYRMYKNNIGSLDSPKFTALANKPNFQEFIDNPEGAWIRCPSALTFSQYRKVDIATSETMRIRNNKPIHMGPTTRALRNNISPYLNRITIYSIIEGVKGSAEEVDDPEAPIPIKFKLRILPIIHIHNPYNVAMEIPQMRVTLFVKNAMLHYEVDDETDDEKLINHLKDVEEKDQLYSENKYLFTQFVVDTTSYSPGQIKVFAPERNLTWGHQMPMSQITDMTDPNEFGIEVDHKFDVGVTEASENVKFFTTWNDDSKICVDIKESADSDWSYLWSGDISQLHQRTTGLIEDHGSSSPFDSMPDNIHPPSYYDEPTPISVLDLYVKPSKHRRHSSSDYSYSEGSPTVGFPSFVLGNPLAPSDSNRAYGENNGTAGRSLMSPMMHGHYNFAFDSFPVLESSYANGGDHSTWGWDNGSEGEEFTCIVEVPTAPMSSIGAFQHANITMTGAQPALAIGNSFPSLDLDDFSKTFHKPNKQTFYDLSYYANAELWDRYYFSSISPKESDYSSSKSQTISSLDEVVSDFMEGEVPLLNSRVTLRTTSQDNETIADELLDFKTSAAHLAIKGGFNINSTSVEAWKAMLAGNRNKTLLDNTGSEIDNEDLSTLSRSSRPAGEGYEEPSESNSSDSSWSGFAQLDDAQVEKLAEEIVTEIKRRRAQSLNKKGEVTPFLGLGEFVNRDPAGDKEMQLAGTIQHALNKSEINQALESYGTFTIADFNGLDENIKINTEASADASPTDLEVPLAASSPSFILQSDVLQNIGSSISARSDTFVIRAYGDSVDSKGKILATAWCEAVVQRTTQPINPDPQKPWEVDPNELTNTKATQWGRRFEMVSFRWLNKNEI